jgi:hypothetical protein
MQSMSGIRTTSAEASTHLSLFHGMNGLQSYFSVVIPPVHLEVEYRTYKNIRMPYSRQHLEQSEMIRIEEAL